MRSNSNAVLELEDVRLQFPQADAPVLDKLNLSIKAGEFVTLVGTSGVGKSTLLRAVDGLLLVSAGRVELGSSSKVGRRDRAFVFQDARLLPWRTVLGNVLYGLESLTLSKQDRRKRALETLELVNLADYSKRYPQQLSGGQRQRVGIARALSTQPQLLLMDEPFAALDAITRRELQQELVRIWQSSGAAVLFVTHDMEEAVYLSERIILLAGAPARAHKEYTVSVPRPRQRDNPELFELAAQITGDLENAS